MKNLILNVNNKVALISLIVGLCASFSANAYTYINTQSFALAEFEGGVGKLDSAKTVPWSVGTGYQWVQSEELTIGFEGEYLDNGKVTQNGITTSSNAWVPMFSTYYYWTPHINSDFKMGYGYVTNKTNLFKTSQWEPILNTGIGFLIPFSKMVYLNLTAGITWINQSQYSFSQNLLHLIGKELKELTEST